MASSNYVGSVGTGDPSSLYPYIIDDDDGPPGRDNGNGIFFRNATVTIAQITDGTSQTFLVGERSQNLSRATWTGAVTNANVPLSPSRPRRASTPRAAVPWSSRTPARATARMPPPARPTATSTGRCHPGGANFLFADGSVRFIKEQVGFKIFQALATRQGGEVLSADQF